MLARWLLLLPLLAAGAPAPEGPLLYLPLDGSKDAAISAGEGRERSGAGGSFVAGVRGQAVSLNADARYDSAGNFRPAAGTFACWVRPNWPGASPGLHYLFSLYGSDGDLPGWQSNRWSVCAQGGRISFTIFTAAGKSVSTGAPIAAWKEGEWHHVAATWQGVGSGRPDGELRLFLDGKEAGAPAAGAEIPVGKVGDVLDIGRDSDASPDYADAAMDEVYLYGRALSAEEIAGAVAAVRDGKEPPAPAAVVPAARQAPGWGDAERPYRVRVTLAPEKTARDRIFAALPLDVSSDLARLGRPGAVDPGSLRLVRGDTGAAIPMRLSDGRLEWTDGALAAGQAREYSLYFRTLAYDLSMPLLARAQAGGPAPSAPLRVPDYATDATGRPWDFDQGDFCGIDQWGDKPEYLRNRKVENGVLKMDVSEDPFFIWGDMWGQVQRSQRPVKIDLARYPILEMRVRQSVPQAVWQIYGRHGTSNSLLSYDFPVSGTGWQTVRVDLRRQARWSGVLSAFRIDPTSKVNAHVEIDWVRLTALQEAARSPVELLGSPSAPAARVAVRLENAKPRAGSEQALVVSVQDAAGRPVSGQPVRVSLAAGSGGALAAQAGCPVLPLGASGFRALTRADGTVAFRYAASRRAGPKADQVQAAAEFAAAPTAGTVVAVQAGPPHHYVLSPARPATLRPGEPPLAITAQLADEFGNPLSGAGRKLTWQATSGALEGPASRTGADGSARARFRGDPAKQWVARVSVRDAEGLSGETAPLCVLPAIRAQAREEDPRPEPVKLLPNGYFAAGGRPWLPLGGFYANWVGVPTPDGEWDRRVSFTDATDAQIVAWLKFLKENGVTAERFMLRTHRFASDANQRDGMEPMDVGGRVNPGLFAAFLHYLDLARPFGFRFQLVVHEDYTKPLYYDRQALERWALPWYKGENLDLLPPFQRRFIRDRELIEEIGAKYTDPDVIACQDRYARELAGLLKGNPLLFSYELENEMVDCPADWANHAAATLRAVDPGTPVCVSHGGGGLDTADPAWWKAKTTIDYYNYHLYPDGTTSPEIDYGTAADVLTTYGRMGKPAFLGESAGDQFSGYDRDARRWTMRDIIWFSLTNGNPGCFFWNARGSEVAEFKLANAIAGGIDWTTFRRKRPAIAIAVPHPLADDKWFRTPAGRAAYAMMGRYARHYLDEGADFDFALDAAGYPLRAGVDAFAPPEPPQPEFGISAGYQLKPLVREGEGEALLYVRNFSGVYPWGRQYLRSRRPAPLKVTVRLPGRFRADIWDLDTGRHEERAVAAGETMDLGATEHDFAIHLRR